jgi:hypothetical protein
MQELNRYEGFLSDFSHYMVYFLCDLPLTIYILFDLSSSYPVVILKQDHQNTPHNM